MIDLNFPQITLFRKLDSLEKVFVDFTEAMNEMLLFTQKHSYDQLFTTTGNIKQLRMAA